MSVLTLGRASQKSADPTTAPGNAPAAFPQRAAWAIPDWRHVLSGKPADSPVTEFLRYGLTSAMALACDFALLVLLAELAGVHYLVAAVLGFGAGLLVAYSLSVRWVFRSRRLPSASAERLLFILIGAVGLALNQAIMFGLTELAALPYTASKLASVAAVFTVNFMLRKTLLFTASSMDGINP